MGRKGVSKQKSKKTKTPEVSNKSSSGAISSLTHASASPASQTSGKGETDSKGKVGKKKSSNT